jgi:phage terminase large subunit
MLQKTTAQLKIANLKKRVRVVQGGTSASKTFTIVPMLIDYAITTPNSEISVVSESIPHLKRGAIKDFQKIMQMTGNWKDDQFNKSELRYKFKNGSFIEFFSADQPDKLRGARRHILFINECNNIPFEAYQQLSIRTSKFIYLDYNPTNEFWVHTELIGDSDTDFIILTYKDNEALDQSIVKEIEKAREKAKTSKYWENWWNVYGLGLIGSLEGVVFNNWTQISTVPTDAELISFGMDFGFTNDPTTLVECYRWNGKLVFNELIYQTGLLNSDIIRMTKGIQVSKPIYADSAEPKSIEEIKRGGVFIKPALKGADSIKYGIDYLQQFEMLITSNSTNLIKELRNYQWDKDKDGKTLNKPIDAYNHMIDACRYSVCELSLPKRLRYTA